jgi:hypothetical protein
MPTITARITVEDLDTRPLLQQLDPQLRRLVHAYGRQILAKAKASLKRDTDGKPAAPGAPPESKTGLLKAGLRYAYEPSLPGVGEPGVVVGVIPLGGFAEAGTLEHGGPSYFVGADQVRRQFTMQPHPFMRPALEHSVASSPPYLG